MKYHPLLNPTRTQRFGGNSNPYYKDTGLAGHPGTDFVTRWGDKILSATDGLVYKTFNKDNPDKSKYRAVCVLTKEKETGMTCEITYGHLEKIFVCEGDLVNIGDVLGTMGNTGEVYSNGVRVNEEQRKKGLGTHLHLQKRLVVKTDEDFVQNQYLLDKNGDIYRDSDKKCYLVPAYSNGFNGCSDIEPDLGKWAGFYDPFTEIPQNPGIPIIKKEIGIIERIVELLKKLIEQAR